MPRRSTLRLFGFYKWAVRIVLYGVVLVFFLGTGVIFWLDHVLPHEKLKPILEEKLSEFLQRKVTIENLRWRLIPKPALVGVNVRMYENPETIMVASARIYMHVAMTPLLRKKMEVREVVFVGMKGTLRRTKKGDINFNLLIQDVTEHLRERKKKAGKGIFHRFTIEDGEFNFVDETVQKEPLEFSMKVFASGLFERKGDEKLFPFWLRAEMEGEGGRALGKISGNLSRNSRIEIAFHGFPVRRLGDYLPSLRKMEGGINFKFSSQRSQGESPKWILVLDSEVMIPFPGVTLPSMVVEGTFMSHSTSTFVLRLTGKSSELIVGGSIPRIADKNVTLKLRGPKADLFELTTWWTTIRLWEYPVPSARTFVPGKPSGWKVVANLHFPEAFYKGEKFPDFRASMIRNRSGHVVVDPILAQGFGGTLVAKARFESARQDGDRTPRQFYLEWDLKDVAMERVLKSAGLDIALKGTGQTKGSLKGPLKAPFWRRSVGKVTGKITHGELANVPAVLKTMSALNLRTVFRSKKEEGFPFDKAEIKIELKNGKVIVEEPAIFENKTMQMGFMGEVDLIKEEVDVRVVFNFLTIFGEIIQSIPGVRTILLGDKKSIVPIWLSVKGPLQDPRVEFLQTKTVTGPIWNTIGRVFRLPKAAIKIFSNQSKQGERAQ